MWVPYIQNLYNVLNIHEGEEVEVVEVVNVDLEVVYEVGLCEKLAVFSRKLKASHRHLPVTYHLFPA
jgi:hypothetical protein